jgi:hypothetical protein
MLCDRIVAHSPLKARKLPHLFSIDSRSGCHSPDPTSSRPIPRHPARLNHLTSDRQLPVAGRRSHSVCRAACRARAHRRPRRFNCGALYCRAKKTFAQTVETPQPPRSATLTLVSQMRFSGSFEGSVVFRWHKINLGVRISVRPRTRQNCRRRWLRVAAPTPSRSDIVSVSSSGAGL